MRSSRLTDVVAASETSTMLFPRTYPQDGTVPVVGTRGAVFAHGASLTDTIVLWTPDNLDLGMARLVEDHYVVVSSGLLGSAANWGNAASITKVNEHRDWLVAKGCDADKVLLVGASMGCLPLLNWAIANPTEVAAIALVLPLVDLADVHTNNRGGYAAAIETAHGGAPPSSHNPIANCAALAGIPIKCWYTSDDTICLPGRVTAFETAVGGSAVDLVDIGTGGHILTGNDFDKADVAAFLGTYA